MEWITPWVGAGAAAAAAGAPVVGVPEFPGAGVPDVSGVGARASEGALSSVGAVGDVGVGGGTGAGCAMLIAGHALRIVPTKSTAPARLPIVFDEITRSRP